MNAGPVILVVDDVRMNVKLLEAILHKEGFGVLTAGSGPEARAMAVAERPDLVLLDICMPGEDGMETCARLKRDPATSTIPVIFISDLHDVSNKVQGFGVGAVDYITKPFEKEEVLARVRLHLRLGEAHRMLVEHYTGKLRQLSQAQQALLARPEDFPQARFDVFYRPALEAGGDFFDVIPIGEGIFGYVVADISGHDLGSSLCTSAIKVALHRFAAPLFTPGDTIRILNDIIRPALPEGHFLTLAYAHLNRMRGRLTLISMGHPPAILIGKDGEVRVLESQGDVLGIFDTVAFEQREIPVSPGDRFYLYTDGLLRENAEEGLQECIARLSQACARVQGLPLGEALREMTAALVLPGYEPKDDLLLLGVEI